MRNPFARDRQYCTTCGLVMLVDRKVSGYNANTGNPIIRTTWRCPVPDHNLYKSER